MLFSATQTQKIEDLARLSLSSSPLFVDVTEKNETSTVETLEQVTLFHSKTQHL
jgi:ATP-dependent RNA helicase DDX18/HAS1